MTTRKLTTTRFAASRNFVVFTLMLTLLIACGSSPDSRDKLTSSGVAVVGVTARTGLNVAINRNLLASDFSELLAERREFAVLPAISLRRFLGGARTDDLLTRYAAKGLLAEQDVQLLMAAGMPTPRAIIVRIEEDYIKKLPVRREPVFNQAGAALVDRERRILATQRITRLSVMLVDLRTGRLVWNRQYQVDPVAEASSTKYLGSSFSGSVAAAVADKVLNGGNSDKHPDAPTLGASLNSLLREVVVNMPLN